MTLILDMATGTEYRREAPGSGDAETLEAYHPARDRRMHVELQLALVESPAGPRSAVPPGVDIADLIRAIED
jgi:hypothetical protein